MNRLKDNGNNHYSPGKRHKDTSLNILLNVWVLLVNQSSTLFLLCRAPCIANNMPGMCSRVSYMHPIVLFIIVFNTYSFQHQNIWNRVWELPGPVSPTLK